MLHVGIYDWLLFVINNETELKFEYPISNHCICLTFKYNFYSHGFFFPFWETNDDDITIVQLNQICYLEFSHML